MSHFKKLVLITLFTVFSSTSFSQSKFAEADRDRFIGNIIKNALETYHYRDMKIDDSVSKKAFKEYLKRIDYGKQFLLKSDVAELEEYKTQMDDEMISGKHVLISKAYEIFQKRVKLIETYRKEMFKTAFTFKEKEKLEIDPEKRDFPKDESELKDLWRKTFKQAVLSRYLSMLDDQKDEISGKNKHKNKKKKKKIDPGLKKMTTAEIEKKSMDGVAEKYDKLFSRLLKEDHEDHVEKFINSIAAIYDPHTSYLPPKKKEDFDIDISGNLEGIGAVLQEDGAYIKVVQIVPGGAAWRQKGLEVDDVILFVTQEKGDPVDLTGMRVDDAVRYIRGKKNTKVSLTVKKVDGSRKSITIIRDVVQISASLVKSSVLELKGLNIKVGYIYVPKFYRDFNGKFERNCTDDVKTELERLKKFKVDSVILDLRNNGGGALEDAKLMSGLFIEKGPIVQVRDRTDIEILSDTDSSVTYDGPVIVMVNRFSASASEIVAAALQDYQRAVVIGGDQTHGKGTVQAVLNLNQGPLLSMFGPTMGALKVTIQKFYRINGSSTQYKGIIPDITIPDPMSYSKSREQDLDYSLEWDSIAAKPFNVWKKFTYNIPSLMERSQKRSASNVRFKRINESVAFLKKKQEETMVSLNIDEVIEEEKQNKAISEKLKLDEKNKNLMVTHFEESLKESIKFSSNDDKKWKKDLQIMKDEWIDSLQQDPGLEEAIWVSDDIVKTLMGVPLAAVK